MINKKYIKPLIYCAGILLVQTCCINQINAEEIIGVNIEQSEEKYYQTIPMISDLGATKEHGEIKNFQVDGAAPWNQCYSVWYPDGYDASKKYNVIVALHGQGGYPREWTDAKHWDAITLNRTFRMTDVWQKDQEITPFCVVTPNFGSWSDASIPIGRSGFIVRPVHEKFIESIKQNVSTYDTPEHFALVGGSLGANWVLNGYDELEPLYGTHIAIADSIDQGFSVNNALLLKSKIEKMQNPSNLWIAFGESESNGRKKTARELHSLKNVKTFEIEKGQHTHWTWAAMIEHFIKNEWGKKD